MERTALDVVERAPASPPGRARCRARPHAVMSSSWSNARASRVKLTIPSIEFSMARSRRRRHRLDGVEHVGHRAVRDEFGVGEVAAPSSACSVKVPNGPKKPILVDRRRVRRGGSCVISHRRRGYAPRCAGARSVRLLSWRARRRGTLTVASADALPACGEHVSVLVEHDGERERGATHRSDRGEVGVVGHRRPRPGRLVDPVARRVVVARRIDGGAHTNDIESLGKFAGLVERDQFGDLVVAVRAPVGEEHDHRRVVARSTDGHRRAVEALATHHGSGGTDRRVLDRLRYGSSGSPSTVIGPFCWRPGAGPSSAPPRWTR